MARNSFVTVTDQFCGAGGFSIGVEAAGAELHLAMNHWRRAVETYSTNHQNTRVVCADVSLSDPRRFQPTDILITSPECTNHSLAKGRKRGQAGHQADLWGSGQPKPEDERSRATMWDVPRFAEAHGYEIVIVENVVDAREWILFDSWLHAMHALGYEHKCVYFNSMFSWPVPQSRDRMYVVFWKRGNQAPNLEFNPPAWCPKCMKDVSSVQSWKRPDKQWGRYGANRQYVYRCPACTEMVTPYYYCAFNAIDWSLPAPRIGDRDKPLKPNTLRRIEIGLEKYGRQGLMIQLGHTHAQNNRTCPMNDPFPTQTATQTVGMVVPLDYDKIAQPLSEPLPTQTSRQSFAFVVAMRGEGEYNAHPITGVLPTQTTIGAPYLVELHGSSTAHSIDDPLGCVLAGGGHHGVVVPPAFLASVNYFADNLRPMDQPMPTQTTGNKMGVVTLPNGPQPYIVSYYSQGGEEHGIDEPLPTVPTVQRHALVQPPAFIMSYYNRGDDQAAVSPIAGPLPTQPTWPLHYLVQTKRWEGDLPKVEDLGFRMLVSHEIGKAMAFPDNYVVTGNERDRVKQYGNAVTPPVATQLFARCVETLAG